MASRRRRARARAVNPPSFDGGLREIDRPVYAVYLRLPEPVQAWLRRLVMLMAFALGLVSRADLEAGSNGYPAVPPLPGRLLRLVKGVAEADQIDAR